MVESVLGVHVGTLAHILAAAAGISAVLPASATAFTVVKSITDSLYAIGVGSAARRLRGSPGSWPASA